MYVTYNSHLVKTNILSRLDGISGTILLFIGFVLQLLGYLNLSAKIIGAIFLGLLLFVLVFYCSFLRKKLFLTQDESIKQLCKEKEEGRYKE